MSTTILSCAPLERVRRMERRHSVTLRRPVADEMRGIISKYGDLEGVIQEALTPSWRCFATWNAVAREVQEVYAWCNSEIPPAWVIRYCLKEPKFILTKKGWRNNAVVDTL